MSWDSGRTVAYLGGSAVSLSGMAEKAKAAPPVQTVTEQSISLLQFPISIAQVNVTVGDIATLVGAGVVVVRLVWDIYKEAAKRKIASKDNDSL